MVNVLEIFKVPLENYEEPFCNLRQQGTCLINEN